MCIKKIDSIQFFNKDEVIDKYDKNFDECELYIEFKDNGIEYGSVDGFEIGFLPYSNILHIFYESKRDVCIYCREYYEW